jgi:hypothetical protein
MARVPILTLAALMLGARAAVAEGVRPPVEIGLEISGVAADPHHEDPLPTQTPAAEMRLTLHSRRASPLKAGLPRDTRNGGLERSAITHSR